MFGFLTRLFGGKNNVIKDPEIGKVRYLESENGHVWAGSVLASANAQPTSANGETIQFFIASKEMVLRHESKNAILDILDNYEDHMGQIDQRLILDHPMSAGSEIMVQFLHIPAPEANYDAEFICQVGDQSFSAIFDGMKLHELILHEG